jgi:hypothetical protein
MWLLKQPAAPRPALLASLVVSGALLVWAFPVTAQDKQPPDHAKHQHADKAPDADKTADQIRDLQAKVAQLEAALKQGHQAAPTGAAGKGGIGMSGNIRVGVTETAGMMGGQKMGPGMMGMGGMEGMDRDEMGQMMQKMGQMMQKMGQMQGKGSMGGMMDMMGGMGGKGMGGMTDDDMDMMGMKGMGGMSGSKGMGKMKMTSALPGFPGASHIYHIGATDFLLDHPEHITLSTEQQTRLNQIKQKALTDKANAQRKIDEAEQQLWELTGADEPDAGQVEAKVRAIEKLRGEQRMAFISAVGEAAKVLTDEQRKALLGTAQPPGHKHTP